ncbi:MAG: META domain-containing protein [bacterium]
MNKKTLAIFIALLVILVGIIVWPSNKNKNSDTAMIGAVDPMNATYTIGDEKYTMVNGKVEKDIVPGSASKNIVRIFGTPTIGDLNGDGTNDAAMFLQQTTGGTGIFYYVALAINKDGKYFGTNAVFLGDRIAPQTVDILDGKAVANFAIRKEGEPMVAQPSLGKSIWIKLTDQTMKIEGYEKPSAVANEIATTTNASSITIKDLEKKMWVWQDTTYNNDTKIVPKKPAFIVVFTKGSNVAIRTDCNAITGGYSLSGNKITFSKLASTMMFCEGSQEGDFMKGLNEVSSVMFDKSGELIMELKNDSGAMRFK